MHALLIPVRSRTGAKNRLARLLDDAERERLTLAMLADMVTAGRRARSIDRVFVVSTDDGLLSHARTLGAEPLLESELPVPPTHPTGEPQGGLNRAVWRAACTLEAQGVRLLVTIPGDVPLFGPEELDQIVAEGENASAVLVPSASGDGTNALLTSPPSVIVPCFEGRSLAAYRRACEDAGIPFRILDLDGFRLDVDTREDLEALAGANGAGRLSVEVAADLLTSGMRALRAAG